MAKPDPENKYVRTVPATSIDVYDVLLAFNVTCPARQHAIKKLLCAGIRGKGDVLQDLRESLQAIERAVEIEFVRGNDYSIVADKIEANSVDGKIPENWRDLDPHLRVAIDDAVRKALHRFVSDFNLGQDVRRDRRS